jgi:hypothetical protein
MWHRVMLMLPASDQRFARSSASVLRMSGKQFPVSFISEVAADNL